MKSRLLILIVVALAGFICLAGDPPGTSWGSGGPRNKGVKPGKEYLNLPWIRGDAKDAGTAETVARAHLPTGANVVKTTIGNVSAGGRTTYQVFLYYEKK